jgi:multidrug resistance efflux pump
MRRWTSRPLAAGLASRSRPGWQRQRDVPLVQHVVGRVQEVEDLAHADVRHGQVDDLLRLDRRDAYAQRRAKHDAVLAQRLAGDERSELHHEAGPDVERLVAQHLVERPVVEDLDELRIARAQRRVVMWKQGVVVALRFFADGHACSRSSPANAAQNVVATVRIAIQLPFLRV